MHLNTIYIASIRDAWPLRHIPSIRPLIRQLITSLRK